MQQQTAVDWLMDRFLFAGYGLPVEWREQAKQMEKEQIINAYDDGSEERHNEPVNGEQYYYETYESNL